MPWNSTKPEKKSEALDRCLSVVSTPAWFHLQEYSIIARRDHRRLPGLRS